MTKIIDEKYYDAVISKSANIQKNFVETGRQDGKVFLEKKGDAPERKARKKAPAEPKAKAVVKKPAPKKKPAKGNASARAALTPRG